MGEIEYLEQIVDKSLQLMDGDKAAAEAWIRTHRPEFGNKNSLEMVEAGRGEEVLALIGRIMHGVFT